VAVIDIWCDRSVAVLYLTVLVCGLFGSSDWTRMKTEEQTAECTSRLRIV